MNDKIKTNILVRPFIPGMKDEAKDGREPFVTLTYGGVTIEIDYTLMLSLAVDNKSPYMNKTVGMSAYAFKEIIREMEYHMDGFLNEYHRDGGKAQGLGFCHYPLHESQAEVTVTPVIQDKTI